MTSTAGGRGRERTVTVEPDGAVGPRAFRWLAMASVLLLTASYVSVLREVTLVVGGTRSLLAIVLGALVAATVLARAIRPRTATVVALVAATIGFGYYLDASGLGVAALVTSTDALLSDTVLLVTGLPLLRMVEAGLWTLAFAPTPTFLSWYLAVRGRFGLSVVPGGLALAFLVLTGDAGATVTLVGTLAGIAAVGFGDVARRGGSIDHVDLLAVAFAVVVALSMSVAFVPDGPTDRAATAADTNTLEGAIDASPERSAIAGSTELSPEVRFTVESERRSYWRTGVYDRFTGDEWVRTGQRRPLEGPIDEPPGEYDRFVQTVTAETDLQVTPVAPHPLRFEPGTGDVGVEVSAHGQIHPTNPLAAGDSYAAESAVVDPTPFQLRTAGTDYPPAIREQYLQTPEGFSSGFEDRTRAVAAGAEDPYQAAVAVEDHLRRSKGYSLDVDRPDGNVADAFLLEMEEGYCVYFATTMTQMLRSEGIPARYVTGYTAGQQVDDDTYVVRGLDAHAWVEVYFPEYGWVAFDPTPPSDRDEVHTDRLEEAREEDLEGVDTDESEDVPIETDDPPAAPQHNPGDTNLEDPRQNPGGPESGPTEIDDPSPDENESDFDEEPQPENTSAADGPDEEGDDGISVALTRRMIALATLLAAGAIAGAAYRDLPGRTRRTIGLYWHGPRRDPDRDAERAYRRLEGLLVREYRPRRPGESARGYVRALAGGDAADPPIEPSEGRPEEAKSDGSAPTTDGTDTLAADPRVRTVLECYERSVYGGGVDRAAADAAIEAVDELVAERFSIVGSAR